VAGYPGATGLKTGYYGAAGFSVTATASRNDLSLIAVVLGVETKRGCFAEAARLLNETFASYRMMAPARRGASVAQVPVTGGAEETVGALAERDLRVLVRRDDKGVAVDARIARPIAAPVRRGQALGEVVVHRGAEELGRVPVVAERDVAATGWLSWLWNRGQSGSPAP
jgi:D-alanyl-D-alanine carboxypeptidase (penicillin-binding protein 5/6)